MKNTTVHMKFGIKKHARPRLAACLSACLIAGLAPLAAAWDTPPPARHVVREGGKEVRQELSREASREASLEASREASQAASRAMAGVYKRRFVSGIVVPGEKDEAYVAEDVIEIVPFDKEHIYVRARLNFYNGHVCGIAAMARYEDGAFVYRERETPPAGFPACVMKVAVEHGQLTITDRIGPDGARSCDQYCGARGTMNTSIGMDRRRPIRYMERLKASRQYRGAIAEMRATQP